MKKNNFFKRKIKQKIAEIYLFKNKKIKTVFIKIKKMKRTIIF